MAKFQYKLFESNFLILQILKNSDLKFENKFDINCRTFPHAYKKNQKPDTQIENEEKKVQCSNQSWKETNVELSSGRAELWQS